jgi:hypothetical protein
MKNGLGYTIKDWLTEVVERLNNVGVSYKVLDEWKSSTIPAGLINEKLPMGMANDAFWAEANDAFWGDKSPEQFVATILYWIETGRLCK